MLRLLFALLLIVTSGLAQQLTHGPVTGAVTSTSARIFVRTDIAIEVRLKYGTDSNLASGTTTTAPFTTSSGNDYTHIFDIPASGNLSANTTYYVNVLIGASQTPAFTSNFPQFKTFPAEDTDADFSIIFGSCQRSGNDKDALYTNMGNSGALAFLQIGDFGYASNLSNSTSVTTQRNSYKERYSASNFFSGLLKKIPFFHVWDDNDYGENDGDRETAGKTNSLQVFKEYFPTPDLVDGSNGIWHSFKIGNAEFFMLDLRYQRDPNGTTDGTMLGNSIGSGNQRDWFLNAVNNSTAKWQFVISSVVINGTSSSTNDMWSDFDPNHTERDYVVSNLQRENLIFLTGDRHGAGLDDGTNSNFVEFSNGLLAPANKSAPNGSWSEGTYSGDNAYGKVNVSGSNNDVVLTLYNSNNSNIMNLTVPYVTDSPLPVILASFRAEAVNEGIRLNWETAAELETIGFRITRSVDGGEHRLISDYLENPDLAGSGNSSTSHFYSYTDARLDEGRQFNYRLYEISYSGNETFLGEQTLVMTPAIADNPHLLVNYPNPFNGATRIPFLIPDMAPEPVRITVYNTAGQRIRSLSDNYYAAGQHSVVWDGMDDLNRPVASGSYIIMMQQGNRTDARRIQLLK